MASTTISKEEIMASPEYQQEREALRQEILMKQGVKPESIKFSYDASTGKVKATYELYPYVEMESKDLGMTPKELLQYSPEELASIRASAPTKTEKVYYPQWTPLQQAQFQETGQFVTGTVYSGQDWYNLSKKVDEIQQLGGTNIKTSKTSTGYTISYDKSPSPSKSPSQADIDAQKDALTKSIEDKGGFDIDITEEGGQLQASYKYETAAQKVANAPLEDLSSMVKQGGEIGSLAKKRLDSLTVGITPLDLEGNPITADTKESEWRKASSTADIVAIVEGANQASVEDITKLASADVGDVFLRDTRGGTETAVVSKATADYMQKNKLTLEDVQKQAEDTQKEYEGLVELSQKDPLAFVTADVSSAAALGPISGTSELVGSAADYIGNFLTGGDIEEATKRDVMGIAERRVALKDDPLGIALKGLGEAGLVVAGGALVGGTSSFVGSVSATAGTAFEAGTAIVGAGLTTAAVAPSLVTGDYRTTGKVVGAIVGSAPFAVAGYGIGKELVTKQLTGLSVGETIYQPKIQKIEQTGRGVIDERTGKLTFKGTTQSDGLQAVIKGSQAKIGKVDYGTQAFLGKSGNKAIAGLSYDVSIPTGKGQSSTLQFTDIVTKTKRNIPFLNLYKTDITSSISMGKSALVGDPTIIREFPSGNLVQTVTNTKFGGITFSTDTAQPYVGKSTMDIIIPTFSSGSGGRGSMTIPKPPPALGGIGSAMFAGGTSVPSWASLVGTATSTGGYLKTKKKPKVGETIIITPTVSNQAVNVVKSLETGIGQETFKYPISSFFQSSLSVFGQTTEKATSQSTKQDLAQQLESSLGMESLTLQSQSQAQQQEQLLGLQQAQTQTTVGLGSASSLVTGTPITPNLTMPKIYWGGKIIKSRKPLKVRRQYQYTPTLVGLASGRTIKKIPKIGPKEASWIRYPVDRRQPVKPKSNIFGKVLDSFNPFRQRRAKKVNKKGKKSYLNNFDRVLGL